MQFEGHKRPPTNTSELHLNTINVNVFFKEFTFGFNNFIKNADKNEIELADNIVWLDDFSIIYEVKERNTAGQKPFI